MELYTIGFTQKSAEEFFEPLRRRGIRRLIDIRLNNTSQLAGFAKGRDLVYFLRELCGAEYVHEPGLAPTKEILDRYRETKDWDEYETSFIGLLDERKVAERFEKAFFDGPAVLLCSEPTADKCHRRLVVEHLEKVWGPIERIDL